MLGIAPALLAAAVVPLLVTDRFWLDLLTLGWINLVAVLGLVLLFGYANQISFGHGAFVGVGAYVSGLLSTDVGLPLEITVPLAMSIGWVIGYALGRPILRLLGLGLAMGTLAIGLLFNVAFRELSLTGGPNGLPGIPALSLGPLDLSSPDGAYWTALVVAIATLLVCHNIVHSRVGRSLRAIGSSHTAASVTGIDPASYKAAIFALSASLAALSGALYAHHVTFVSPGTFGLHLSILLVVMVVAGGVRSLWGAAVAALGLTVLSGHLGGFGAYSGLIFGAILIAIFTYAPGGIAGLVGTLINATGKLRAPRPSRRSTAAQTR